MGTWIICDEMFKWLNYMISYEPTLNTCPLVYFPQISNQNNVWLNCMPNTKYKGKKTQPHPSKDYGSKISSPCQWSSPFFSFLNCRSRHGKQFYWSWPSALFRALLHLTSKMDPIANHFSTRYINLCPKTYKVNYLFSFFFYPKKSFPSFLSLCRTTWYLFDLVTGRANSKRWAQM